MEMCQKILTPHAPLFKVTGTDTDRSATDDFLLVCDGIYMGRSRIFFRAKWQYLANFLLYIYHPPLRGFPLEFCNAVELEKL